MVCWNFICLTTVLLVLPNVQTAKILGFLVTPSQAQFNVHDALMKGLAAKGHEVTVVGIYPPQATSLSSSNYRYVYVELDNSEERDLDKLKNKIFRNSGDDTSELIFKKLPKMLTSLLNIAADTLRHPTVAELKATEEFDLIIFGWFFNDFQLGLAAHFKCPAILVSTVPAIKMLRDYVGNPPGLAYTPSFFSPFSDNMTLQQRILNFGLHAIEHIASNAFEYFLLEPYYRELFPVADGYPTLGEAKRNVSLVLLNHHFSERYPTPNFPALVEVGGVNLNFQFDPLSKDYKEFLDDATDGVILFALGTLDMHKFLAEDKLNVLLKFFGTLKQRVIMKWELDTLPRQPKNVKIGKWLPQQAILAHPNVRLFMSHCGRNSMNEARMHGVPILGMPVHGEQHLNLKMILDEGWGMPFSYAFMNEEALKFSFNETLNNTRYRDNVRETAVYFSDRQQPALKTAIYWVEYVLRHHGAPALRSHAVYLNWFQYHSIDVVAIYLATAYVLFKVIKFVLSTFVWLACCCRRRSTVTNQNKQVDAQVASKAKPAEDKVKQKNKTIHNTKSKKE